MTFCRRLPNVSKERSTFFFMGQVEPEDVLKAKAPSSFETFGTDHSPKSKQNFINHKTQILGNNVVTELQIPDNRKVLFFTGSEFSNIIYISCFIKELMGNPYFSITITRIYKHMIYIKVLSTAYNVTHTVGIIAHCTFTWCHICSCSLPHNTPCVSLPSGGTSKQTIAFGTYMALIGIAKTLDDRRK